MKKRVRVKKNITLCINEISNQLKIDKEQIKEIYGKTIHDEIKAGHSVTSVVTSIVLPG